LIPAFDDAGVDANSGEELENLHTINDDVNEPTEEWRVFPVCEDTDINPCSSLRSQTEGCLTCVDEGATVDTEDLFPSTDGGDDQNSSAGPEVILVDDSDGEDADADADADADSEPNLDVFPVFVDDNGNADATIDTGDLFPSTDGDVDEDSSVGPKGMLMNSADRDGGDSDGGEDSITEADAFPTRVDDGDDDDVGVDLPITVDVDADADADSDPNLAVFPVFVDDGDDDDVSVDMGDLFPSTDGGVDENSSAELEDDVFPVFVGTDTLEEEHSDIETEGFPSFGNTSAGAERSTAKPDEHFLFSAETSDDEQVGIVDSQDLPTIGDPTVDADADENEDEEPSVKPQQFLPFANVDVDQENDAEVQESDARSFPSMFDNDSNSDYKEEPSPLHEEPNSELEQFPVIANADTDDDDEPCAMRLEELTNQEHRVEPNQEICPVFGADKQSGAQPRHFLFTLDTSDDEEEASGGLEVLPTTGADADVDIIGERAEVDLRPLLELPKQTEDVVDDAGVEKESSKKPIKKLMKGFVQSLVSYRFFGGSVDKESSEKMEEPSAELEHLPISHHADGDDEPSAEPEHLPLTADADADGDDDAESSAELDSSENIEELPLIDTTENEEHWDNVPLIDDDLGADSWEMLDL